MSLLHATWLQNIEDSTSCEKPVIFLWADQWSVAKPKEIKNKPVEHPFSLSREKLLSWLKQRDFLKKHF